jgi:alpha-L-fucosidase
MGLWLKKYGESIYGTRGGPFKPNSAVASTRKDDIIYVHMLRPQAGPLALPPIPRKIKSAALLTGGKVTFTQSDEGISLQIPSDCLRDIDTIIKLTLDGSAMDIQPLAAIKPISKLPKGSKVAASNVYQNMPEHAPEMAFDRDPDTRWATDGGVRRAWLKIEYPEPAKVSSIAMSEEYDRVRSFELQYQDGADWKTIFAGTTIGLDYKKDFEPVTANRFRLNILDATDGPTFWEIGMK